MKNHIIIVCMAASLFSLHCSETSDSTPPALFNTGEEGGSNEGSEATEDVDAESRDLTDTGTEGEEQAPVDTAQNDISEDPDSDGATESPESDTEASEEGGEDAEETEDDAVQDSTGPDDDTKEVGEDGNAEDTSEEGDTVTADAESEDIVDEEVEEPGECETDDDCLFLTAQVCCPALAASPCAIAPEVGTLEDEVAAVAWIQSNCAAVESCPDIVAPACSDCLDLYSYAPICDKSIGECALESEPDCDAICEAISITSDCPSISDPEALTEDLVNQCGCF